MGVKEALKSKSLALALASTLAGCASSTGILPAGPDTFTLSERFAPVRGGGDEAERVALTKASDYCAQQGKQFVPAMMGASGVPAGVYGQTGYTVTFKCLQPNDPAVKTYQVERAPNLVVEQRNR